MAIIKKLLTLFTKILPVLCMLFVITGFSKDDSTLLNQSKSKYVNLEVLFNPQDSILNPNGSVDFSLVYRFTILKPFHVNSSNPLIEGLIPTVTTLSTPIGKIIKKNTIYPPDEILDIAGFKTTTYSGGPHEIIETYNFVPEEKRNHTITAKYIFSYQACIDDECYAPESISEKINLTLNKFKKENGTLLSSLTNSLTQIDWSMIILFAFLGGLILNFTPCVLPILSLKLFSLATIKKTEKSLKKKYVLYYTLGVLVFFFLLATTLSILKYTGESIGWGMHFQSPYYIFFIITILTLVAFNFFGLYELNFSYQKNSSSLDKSEKWENFGVGFISVILATPCTVPFLGVAVAYAFSKSIFEIIVLHFFIALGFLTPYLLIFINIDISKLLPTLRPIQKYIKPISGFILLMTIFWLIDIYQKLTSTQNLFFIFGAIWIITLILWIFGQIQKKLINLKFELIFWLVFIGFLGWINIQLTSMTSVKPLDIGIDSNLNDTPKGKTFDNKTSLIKWKQFNRNDLTKFLTTDKIIYIHFTADWCLNCKVNEKLIIENQEVVELFDQYEVIPIKADWTKTNKEIFTEITRLGRAGIPLDVFYRGDKEIILSSILTIDTIKNQLKAISQ